MIITVETTSKDRAMFSSWPKSLTSAGAAGLGKANPRQIDRRKERRPPIAPSAIAPPAVDGVNMPTSSHRHPRRKSARPERGNGAAQDRCRPNPTTIIASANPTRAVKSDQPLHEGSRHMMFLSFVHQEDTSAKAPVAIAVGRAKGDRLRLGKAGQSINEFHIPHKRLPSKKLRSAPRTGRITRSGPAIRGVSQMRGERFLRRRHRGARQARRPSCARRCVARASLYRATRPGPIADGSMLFSAVRSSTFIAEPSLASRRTRPELKREPAPALWPLAPWFLFKCSGETAH